MRNVLTMVLLLTAFLLGTVTFATAGVVTWKILESTNPAGMGPGPDGVIGVPGCPGTADNDDTTTLEFNGCNFSTAADCVSGGTPSSGSYSYGATEYLMTKSCVGGPNGGAPCVDGADCPDSICYSCTENPGWDLIIYTGDLGTANGNGTMTWCQDSGASGSTITGVKHGLSSIDPASGPMCTVLDPAGGPNTTTACGVDVPLSYSHDVLTKAFNCTLTVVRVDGITFDGRVIDINDATPTPTCGYSAADILCLQAEAPPSATYLLISCADPTTPDPSDMMCMAGAPSNSKNVYWTADDASDCTSECDPGGGCVANTALTVE